MNKRQDNDIARQQEAKARVHLATVLVFVLCRTWCQPAEHRVNLVAFDPAAQIRYVRGINSRDSKFLLGKFYQAITGVRSPRHPGKHLTTFPAAPALALEFRRVRAGGMRTGPHTCLGRQELKSV